VSQKLETGISKSFLKSFPFFFFREDAAYGLNSYILRVIAAQATVNLPYIFE
jgi:hypothetical protein